MRYLLASLLLCLVVGSCSKSPAPKAALSTAPPPAAATVAAPVQVAMEEPSAAVLRDLAFQRTDALDAKGGMPLQSTQTGRSVTVRPKLYEVHKDKCTASESIGPGVYECDLTVKVSFSADGENPSMQGDRIFVKRGPNGDWMLN